MKMKDIFSIKEKVIIITGGGKGIGHDLSINMTKRGAFVYAIDIKFQNIAHNDEFLFKRNVILLITKNLKKSVIKFLRNTKKLMF